MAKKIKAVRPEIIPASPDSMAETYKQMIEQDVDERVAELMATRKSKSSDRSSKPRKEPTKCVAACRCSKTGSSAITSSSGAA